MCDDCLNENDGLYVLPQTGWFEVYKSAILIMSERLQSDRFFCDIVNKTL